MSTVKPVLVLIVSSVGWGLTWLPLNYFAGTGLNGMMLIMLAFGAAFLFLLPAVLKQAGRWKHAWRMMLLVVVLGGAANLSFQTALYHGDVIRVMILFYLLPLWSVLGGRIFLGEQITLMRFVTLAAALVGGYLVLGDADITSVAPGWIDVLAVISGFTLAMNNIVFRATAEIPVISKVGAMFGGVVLFMVIYLALNPRDIEFVSTTVHVEAVLYGVFWLTLITAGTQWGVTHMEAGRASIIIVLELVVAVISAMIILDSVMTAREISGAVLVTLAAVLESGRSERSASSHVPSQVLPCSRK